LFNCISSLILCIHPLSVRSRQSAGLFRADSSVDKLKIKKKEFVRSIVGEIMKKRLLQSVFLVLFLPASVMLLAQWNGYQSKAICTADWEQIWAAMVPDGAGGAIIVWQDHRTNSRYELYAQRINAQGVTLWAQNGVSVLVPGGTGTFTYSDKPKIIPDGNGGAIVACIDNQHLIYAQKINSSGVVQWAAGGIKVCQNTTYDFSMTTDQSGGAILGWYETRNPASESGIYMQRITSGGNIAWDAYGKKLPLSFSGGSPQIISDNAGGAILIFNSWKNTVSETGHWVQRINSSGNLMWSADCVQVYSGGSSYDINKIIEDGSGGAFITWNTGSPVNLYSQRVDASGNVLWSSNGVNITSSASPEFELARDNAGNFYIVWSDQTHNPYLMRAQKLNQAGALQWGWSGVFVYTTYVIGHQATPAVCVGADNNPIVTWAEYGANTNISYDIFMQKLNTDGSRQWAGTDGIVYAGVGTQHHPAILADNNNGAIIVWNDGRAGNYWADIYAAHVSSAGVLGIDNNDKTVPTEFSIYQNYPNPFNPVTNIKFTLPKESRVTIEIFNSIGQRIDVGANGVMAAGSHTIRWNSAGYSSGVYYYKIKAVPNNSSQIFSGTKKMIVLK
jgi:hypothetical protein